MDFTNKKIKQEIENESESRRTEESSEIQVKLEDNVQKQLKICRLCAQPIVHNEIYIYKSDIEQKINCILPTIRIFIGDGLPEYVCETCEINLNTAYNFICQAKNADQNLQKQMISNEIATDKVANLLIRQIFGEDSNDSIRLEQTSTTDSPGCKILKPDEGTIHTCLHCLQKFNDAYIFNKHVELCKKPDLFTCTECSNDYTTEKSLREHIQAEHNVPVICYTCGKLFVSLDALNNHKRKMHASRTCGKCWMSFKSDFSFDKHRQLHANTDENQCVFCFKTFENQSKLRRHAQNHTGNFVLTQ